MTTGSARMRVQTQQSTAINDSVRARVSTAANRSTAEQSNIQSNPIFQIMLAGEATPVQRKAAFEQFMTATLEREIDRARIKQYEEFREWLSHQTTALAQQIIELTNTKTFASLQKVIEDMNSGLIGFEKDLDPLMEIVDSIYQLRTADKLYDAFGEIEKDKNEEEKRINALAALKAKMDDAAAEKERLRLASAEASQKRGFFGFGGLTEDARKEIARNEAIISRLDEELEETKAKEAELRNQKISSTSVLEPEMAVHKERLKKLLNLSSEDNIGNMERLRDSALKFVEHSKENTAIIRGEFGTLSGQLDNAEDNNRRMSSIYGIMTEGMKGAATNNVNKQIELDAKLAEVGDDLIAKHDIEDGLRNLNAHSKMLHSAQGETLNTYAELTEQAIRVGSMKEATNQQVEIARKLNTQGVAATADRLASVMTAVSGAAITESAGVVESTLNRMRTKTNDITQQEVIRNAMYVDKINNEMESVFGELEQFREVQRVSSGMIREGIAVMNENMTALLQQTNHLREEMKEGAAIYTQMAHTNEGDATAALGLKPAAAETNAFKF